jgi:hypothetical protein
VSKNGLFEPFIHKNDHFTKTGSGQTKGKLKKNGPFFLRRGVQALGLKKRLLLLAMRFRY